MGKKVLKDWKSDWVVLGSPSETRRKEARGGKGRGGGGEGGSFLWAYGRTRGGAFLS